MCHKSVLTPYSHRAVIVLTTNPIGCIYKERLLPHVALTHTNNIERMADKDDDSQKVSPMASPTESQTVSQAASTEKAFTVFERHDRHLLMVTLSLIGFWSTVLAAIYFPAIPVVAKYFNISDSLLNVSLVSYLLLQGLAPAISCSLADYFGLRPVLVCSILCYTCICVAISQTNVYWLIVVLRCLQLALISPVIAIGAGISGDICTRKTRGGFIGTVGGFQVTGGGFGAVIGAGLISGFHTWRSIFVFLAIGGGVTFVFALIILPETSRKIVGNGLVDPKGIQHRLLFLYLPHFKKQLTNDVETIEPRKAFDILATFRILLHWDMIIALIPCGMIYASWNCLLAEISTVLGAPPFNYCVMHVGYVYMPQGVMTLAGSLVAGRILNWYYAYRKKQYNEKKERDMIEEKVSSEYPPFDNSRARLDVCLIPIGLFVIGLTMFGWCLEYRVNIATIYISSILVAFSLSVMISAVTTLAVDRNPGQGHSASSCVNMVRCWLGALFIGVLDNMVKKMGLGGTFTFLAGVTAVLSGVMIWRFSNRAQA